MAKDNIRSTGFPGYDLSYTFGYAFDSGEEVFITYRETDKRGEAVWKDVMDELSARWKDSNERFRVGRCKECGSWELGEQQIQAVIEKKFDYQQISRLLGRISGVLKKRKT